MYHMSIFEKVWKNAFQRDPSFWSRCRWEADLGVSAGIFTDPELCPKKVSVMEYRWGRACNGPVRTWSNGRSLVKCMEYYRIGDINLMKGFC